MIVLDCPQGGPEWTTARLGIPTASEFGRILTPAKMEYSKGARTYCHELLSEWATGLPVERGDSAFMQRGTRMEDEARRWYEMQRDVEVQRVGLVLRDDRQVGGSPDGLVGEDGGLEIKVPALHTHVSYLLGEDQPYVPQLQGLMYLTGRSWWDFLSYNPVLPKLLVRVERNEKYIAALDKALGTLLVDLLVGKHRLLELGVRVPPEDMPPPLPTVKEVGDVV